MAAPKHEPPLDVRKYPTNGHWVWDCWNFDCPDNGHGVHDTHAEALAAALNHCATAGQS